MNAVRTLGRIIEGVVLYFVALLWLLWFLDEVLGTNLYTLTLYRLGIENELVFFSLCMAVVVPFLVLLRLMIGSLEAHHYAACTGWFMFLYCVYVEVVVYQAF